MGRGTVVASDCVAARCFGVNDLDAMAPCAMLGVAALRFCWTYKGIEPLGLMKRSYRESNL